MVAENTVGLLHQGGKQSSWGRTWVHDRMGSKYQENGRAGWPVDRSGEFTHETGARDNDNRTRFACIMVQGSKLSAALGPHTSVSHDSVSTDTFSPFPRLSFILGYRKNTKCPRPIVFFTRELFGNSIEDKFV